MAPLQWIAERHIERQIADPALRAKVTPDYTIGCKRILLSSAYYPALTRPNVDLVTAPGHRLTETGLACADGSSYDVDVIIYGTGFKTVEAVAELNVAGRDGVKLQDVWRERHRGPSRHHRRAVSPTSSCCSARTRAWGTTRLSS